MPLTSPHLRSPPLTFLLCAHLPLTSARLPSYALTMAHLPSPRDPRTRLPARVLSPPPSRVTLTRPAPPALYPWHPSRSPRGLELASLVRKRSPARDLRRPHGRASTGIWASSPSDAPPLGSLETSRPDARVCSPLPRSLRLKGPSHQLGHHHLTLPGQASCIPMSLACKACGCGKLTSGEDSVDSAPPYHG